MDKLWLIIKREYLTKVKNKTFIIMTFVSPLIFVGLIALIAFLTSVNSEEVRTVAILDETTSFTPLFQNSEDYEYIFLQSVDLEAAKIASEEAEYYGLLYITPDAGMASGADAVFYSEESPSVNFLESIEDKISKEITHQNLQEAGIDEGKLEEARYDAELQLQNFTGVQTSKAAGWIKIAFGGAAGYLLMMFIIIYGNMLMRSVIEEKTNRIIEIIVSSVKPVYLMLGKITGTSLAGITQFLIWVVVGLILLIVGSMVFGPEAFQTPTNSAAADNIQDMDKMQLLLHDIAQLPLLKLVICFFIYFIGGYFLYASIYTAIGAAVDNETDTQQFMLPVIVPLMLAIYVGFFSVMDNPHGTVAQVFSYIPLTSPIVMLMRIPFGEIAWWELGLSMLLLYSSIILMAWFAAKIYRIGILMYGKKVNYKELAKWLKY